MGLMTIFFRPFESEFSTARPSREEEKSLVGSLVKFPSKNFLHHILYKNTEKYVYTHNFCLVLLIIAGKHLARRMKRHLTCFSEFSTTFIIARTLTLKIPNWRIFVYVDLMLSHVLNKRGFLPENMRAHDTAITVPLAS